MPRPTVAAGEHRFALLAPGLANAFQMLRLSASIYERRHWRVIHYEPNLATFEVEHGVERERDRYNGRSIQRARGTGTTVRGEHAGMYDLFVPVSVARRTSGVLITGPFLTERPRSTEILERWRKLTRRQGDLADPEFAQYVSVTLSTLVLDSGLDEVFRRFAESFAELLAGRGHPERLFARAERLRDRVETARAVDRAWEAVATMVDERTSQTWHSPQRIPWLATLGLSRVPDAALVGLTVAAKGHVEPVEELLRRHAFQRACAKLARSKGELVCGRVGDHGIALLSSSVGSRRRQRQRLLAVGEEARQLARRFQFDLHLGLSTLPESVPLSEQYDVALAAAESALSENARVVEAATPSTQRALGLGSLRRELADLASRQPASLPGQFELYVEAVTRHAGYRIDAVRAHLEAGFERIVEVLSDAALEGRDLADATLALSRAVRQSSTVTDVCAAYRRAIADVSEALVRPVSAHRDRSLRRAMTYIEHHFAEPITLLAAARVAGFAPNYFSRLFKQREHVTFNRYVQRLRIDRARQLLTHSDLDNRRIAQLSGFASASYFTRAFRRETGLTPRRFRVTAR